MNLTVDLSDKELVDFLKTRDHKELKGLVEKDEPQGAVVVNLRMTATMLAMFLRLLHNKSDADKAEKNGVATHVLESPTMFFCKTCKRKFIAEKMIGDLYVENMEGGLTSLHSKEQSEVVQEGV